MSHSQVSFPPSLSDLCEEDVEHGEDAQHHHRDQSNAHAVFALKESVDGGVAGRAQLVSVPAFPHHYWGNIQVDRELRATVIPVIRTPDQLVMDSVQLPDQSLESQTDDKQSWLGNAGLLREIHSNLIKD